MAPLPPEYRPSTRSTEGTGRSLSSLSRSSLVQRMEEAEGEQGKEVLLRVGSWCVGGVEHKPDSLDVLLYNEGKPLDILLLQSTKGKVPEIEGYTIVESPAPDYDPIGGVAIMWKEQTVKGNQEKIEVTMEGRLVRMVLSLRTVEATFNVATFHGYAASKKGNRRRIDLLEKLKSGKGLSKRRKNILGGNFNVVENDRDRASWANDVIRKEKTVKEKLQQIVQEFGVYDTYQAENPHKFEEVQDEETAKKRQRVQQFRVDMSHEDIARMDRIYISKEALPVDFHTNTYYLDHGGSHKLCVTDFMAGEKMEGRMDSEPFTMVERRREVETSSRMMVGLEEVLAKLSSLEGDMKGVQGALTDIKTRI